MLIYYDIIHIVSIHISITKYKIMNRKTSFFGNLSILNWINYFQNYSKNKIISCQCGFLHFTLIQIVL
jgi:hypothetical protein